MSVCRAGDAVNHALLKELLGYFIEENRRRVESALQAVIEDDREALRDIAHAMSGSAALLGAGRLHALASAIEHEAKPGEIRALRAAVAALSVEFDAVLAALRTRHPEALAQ